MRLSLLFILITLPLVSLAANQAEFVQCSDFGCKTTIEMDFNQAQWAELRQIFSPLAASAFEEKQRIRRAIALMEQYAGEISGTKLDKAENYPGIEIPHQQDCIDESTNTFQYLFALQKRGFLKWHQVVGKKRRIVWFFTHWSALIRDITEDQLYVVDSWYRDNGEPPYIQKLQDWESKKAFPIALNP